MATNLLLSKVKDVATPAETKKFWILNGEEGLKIGSPLADMYILLSQGSVILAEPETAHGPIAVMKTGSSDLLYFHSSTVLVAKLVASGC